MQYHHNAKTNIAQRKAIQEAKSRPNRELAKQYCVSHTTIGHWKNSDQVEDHSSQPKVIHYALTKAEDMTIFWKERDET